MYFQNHEQSNDRNQKCSVRLCKFTSMLCTCSVEKDTGVNI